MKMQTEISGTEVSPKFKRRKWVVRVAAGSAVVVAMAAGSVALFSDTKTSSTNSFDAGTVSVGLGTTSTTCAVELLMPDDSSAGFGTGSQSKSTCTYAVKYTGTVDAWLAADVLVETGTPSLYTGTSNGLQYKVKVAGGPTLVNGTTFTSVAGSSAQVTAGSSVSNILLSSNPAVQGDQLEFNIDYLLPRLAPNALQGGSSTITITFHAVQSANQPIGSCVAGRQCNAITWY